MKDMLQQLAAGGTLTTEQAVDAFEQIMSGQAHPVQIAAMLALIQARGPTVHEIVGAARVMRKKATHVTVPPGLTVVDTCGTGGDGSKTFNISTAAAIVAAAAARPHGVAIAKHGNRAVTSQSGSSQVLQELGVKLRVAGETLTRCLDEAGLCFCFAPAHHPAMKHAMPVRQELGFRTIFNILGPLTNPAGADRQVMGVYSQDLVEPIANVLAELGAVRAMVVHGLNRGGPPLDELTNCGPTIVGDVQEGSVTMQTIDARSLGLWRVNLYDLRADSVAHSADFIRWVLAGTPGPARDITVLNAAAALVVGDVAADLAQGIDLATTAIDSDAAAQTLQRLVDITNADPTPQN